MAKDDKIDIASEKLQEEDNDDITQKRPSIIDFLLTERRILKKGICFLGAICIGLNLYKNLDLERQFQESVITSSYIANSVFFPLDLSNTANIW